MISKLANSTKQGVSIRFLSNSGNIVLHPDSKFQLISELRYFPSCSPSVHLLSRGHPLSSIRPHLGFKTENVVSALGVSSTSIWLPERQPLLSA